MKYLLQCVSFSGTFMLWWGWLAFNTGSTYGVSKYKWRLAARFVNIHLFIPNNGYCHKKAHLDN